MLYQLDSGYHGTQPPSLMSSDVGTSIHFTFLFGGSFFYQFTVDQGNGGGIMTESSVCMTPLPTVRSVFTTLYFLPITNEPETNLNSLGCTTKVRGK